MHLVSGTEAYKKASGAITQALGRIDEVPIKVGGVQCMMTFMVVDTNSYDVLLGLNLLIIIEVMGGAGHSSQQGICERLVELGSESDSDSSEGSEETTQLVENDEGASEFGDTEFEELVKKEGPQQILQLTMQAKADEFMKEELADDDDYSDWIQWAVEEEQRMQSLSKAAIAAEEFVLL
ncbi:unnamed protein product [Sphagnum tenellum]